MSNNNHSNSAGPTAAEAVTAAVTAAPTATPAPAPAPAPRQWTRFDSRGSSTLKVLSDNGGDVVVIQVSGQSSMKRECCIYILLRRACNCFALALCFFFFFGWLCSLAPNSSVLALPTSAFRRRSVSAWRTEALPRKKRRRWRRRHHHDRLQCTKRRAIGMTPCISISEHGCLVHQKCSLRWLRSRSSSSEQRPPFSA